ncbi:MAG: GlsB/YeaQ/YmgE family stress response membrane protein [Thermoleophilia bacterium]
MIGAVILGLLAGAIARALVRDPFEGMSGPLSWLVSLGVGLGGAWIGWWIFTGLLGIGDSQMFDLGGIVGAVIGAILLLFGLNAIVGARRGAHR